MDIDDKIVQAKAVILQTMEGSANPVIMSSFGKDSMVVLDLFKQLGLKLPILFFREPFHPKKYQFSNKVIEDNDYVVYDYPPLRTAMTKHDGKVEIANFHQVGTEDQEIFLPTGVREPQPGEPWLCGLFDLYDKPLGTYYFRWDTVFIGHKSSDHDPIIGDVPLVDYVSEAGPVRVAFPIRDFTDEDVWVYHERFDVPINDKRYNRADGWREFSDLTYNPDCYPACIACMDRDRETSVLCPKSGTTIPNISAGIQYVVIDIPSYVRR